MVRFEKTRVVIMKNCVGQVQVIGFYEVRMMIKLQSEPLDNRGKMLDCEDK